jgi:hypothetical protein
MGKKEFFILCLSLLASSIFSQKKPIDNSKTSVVSDIFSYSEQVSNFLKLQQIQSRKERGDNSIRRERNVSLIQQVGNNNSIQADNFTGSSLLLYTQIGNNNTIINENNSNITALQRVIQNGNDNGVISISSGDLDIIQNGNGIIYEQIGTSSTINNIQLRLSGNARTVSVRSLGLSSTPEINNQ